MKKTIEIGTWITAPHPSVVDIIARCDLDWICVDLEHSPVSKLEMQTAINIIQAQKKPAFVRVSRNSHNDVKFPLDAGADGIIIPMVNSYQEAKDAVDNCIYPPEGKRSVGLARAQGYGFAFEEHLKRNYSDLRIFVQIEHYQAVEDIDRILALPRLDGVFLGPYDLSGSMGIPGQFTHPKMVAAVEEVAKATQKAQKVLGMHVIQPSHEELLKYTQQGYHFIAFSLDTLLMAHKLRDEINLFRKGFEL